jgi:PTH1 family peptidyl-tRNA hydrolase
MKLIVGLGNPGKKYEYTRHNAGFLALDFILKDLESISCASRFHGQVCEVHFHATRSGAGPVKTFFVKPQTYMNNSGQAVRSIVDFYKVSVATDLLIIHDEIDLKFGFLKQAFDSRAAGHNGVKSIIAELGTQEFNRIRIGVESRKSRLESPTDEYVLKQFSTEDLRVLQESIFPEVKTLVEKFIQS